MASPLSDSFDPTRHATRTPLRAFHIDASPGDMTRYRLTVTEGPHGGWLIASMVGPSLWRSTCEPGDYVELMASASPRHNRLDSPSAEYDRAAITALLDAHVRCDNAAEARAKTDPLYRAVD